MLTARHIAMAAGREMRNRVELMPLSRDEPEWPGDVPDYIHAIAGDGPSAQISLQACPGALERFADGVYSHPLSWWAGIHQLAGMAGLYGRSNKREAQLRASILSQIIHAALNHPRQTVPIVRFMVEHHLRNNLAGTFGRLVGGFFTNYATRGGAAGRSLSPWTRRAMGLGNFLLASYGAAMIGIAQGRNQIQDVIGMILTGNYRFDACAPAGMPPIDLELGGLSDMDLFLLEYLEEIYHLNSDDQFRSERFVYRDLLPP